MLQDIENIFFLVGALGNVLKDKKYSDLTVNLFSEWSFTLFLYAYNDSHFTHTI